MAHLALVISSISASLIVIGSGVIIFLQCKTRRKYGMGRYEECKTRRKYGMGRYEDSRETDTYDEIPGYLYVSAPGGEALALSKKSPPLPAYDLLPVHDDSSHIYAEANNDSIQEHEYQKEPRYILHNRKSRQGREKSPERAQLPLPAAETGRQPTRAARASEQVQTSGELSASLHSSLIPGSLSENIEVAFPEMEPCDDESTEMEGERASEQVQTSGELSASLSSRLMRLSSYLNTEVAFPEMEPCDVEITDDSGAAVSTIPTPYGSRTNTSPEITDSSTSSAGYPVFIRNNLEGGEQQTTEGPTSSALELSAPVEACCRPASANLAVQDTACSGTQTPCPGEGGLDLLGRPWQTCHQVLPAGQPPLALLPHSQVTLALPPGAVRVPTVFYVSVHTDLDILTQRLLYGHPDLVFLSPVVEFTTSVPGMVFDRLVAITLPFYAPANFQPENLKVFCFEVKGAGRVKASRVGRRAKDNRVEQEMYYELLQGQPSRQQQLTVFTRHFTLFACAYCRQQVQVDLLALAFTRHSKESALQNESKARIRVFVADGKYEMPDFEQRLKDKQVEEGFAFNSRKQLSLLNRCREDSFLVLELIPQDYTTDARLRWEHLQAAGNPIFPPTQTLPFEEVVQHCLKKEPATFEWALTRWGALGRHLSCALTIRHRPSRCEQDNEGRPLPGGQGQTKMLIDDVAVTVLDQGGAKPREKEDAPAHLSDQLSPWSRERGDYWGYSHTGSLYQGGFPGYPGPPPPPPCGPVHGYLPGYQQQGVEWGGRYIAPAAVIPPRKPLPPLVRSYPGHLYQNVSVPGYESQSRGGQPRQSERLEPPPGSLLGVLPAADGEVPPHRDAQAIPVPPPPSGRSQGSPPLPMRSGESDRSMPGRGGTICLHQATPPPRPPSEAPPIPTEHQDFDSPESTYPKAYFEGPREDSSPPS